MVDKAPATTEKPRLCTTCGTRLGEGATRCLVCGTPVRGSAGRGGRAPRNITLDLRVAVALVAGLALLTAGLTYAASRVVGGAALSATPSGTPTLTATATLVPSVTPTSTIVPSPTTEPPVEYTVAEGDSCLSIAFFFDVSVRSIIELNNLGTQCFLTVGQRVLVPVATPAPTDTPTATLAPAEATEAACPKVTITVEEGDTLFGIAQNYNVAVQSIMDYNGMTSDSVFSGQVLIVPLCERLGGPTATPTVPPPYPAPNLLLPKDGESFSLANDTISLQWAAVAPLREDEFYRVTVVDVTEESLGSGRKTLIEFVTDTQFNLPASFRPTGTSPHVMRWWIETVRLAGTTAAGEPRYASAGASSVKRDFTWSGSAAATPTP
jgi:LysM repeat protein